MAFAPECQRFSFTVRHGAQFAHMLINFAVNGGTRGASGSKTKALLYRIYLQMATVISVMVLRKLCINFCTFFVLK